MAVSRRNDVHVVAGGGDPTGVPPAMSEDPGWAERIMSVNELIHLPVAALPVRLPQLELLELPGGRAHERVLELIKKNHHRTAAEIVQALYCEVREFARNSPQLDDLTAIVIKVN